MDPTTSGPYTPPDIPPPPSYDFSQQDFDQKTAAAIQASATQYAERDRPAINDTRRVGSEEDFERWDDAKFEAAAAAWAARKAKRNGGANRPDEPVPSSTRSPDMTNRAAYDAQVPRPAYAGTSHNSTTTADTPRNNTRTADIYPTARYMGSVETHAHSTNNPSINETRAGSSYERAPISPISPQPPSSPPLPVVEQQQQRSGANLNRYPSLFTTRVSEGEGLPAFTPIALPGQQVPQSDSYTPIPSTVNVPTQQPRASPTPPPPPQPIPPTTSRRTTLYSPPSHPPPPPPPLQSAPLVPLQSPPPPPPPLQSPPLPPLQSPPPPPVHSPPPPLHSPPPPLHSPPPPPPPEISAHSPISLQNAQTAPSTTTAPPSFDRPSNRESTIPASNRQSTMLPSNRQSTIPSSNRQSTIPPSNRESTIPSPVSAPPMGTSSYLLPPPIEEDPPAFSSSRPFSFPTEKLDAYFKGKEPSRPSTLYSSVNSDNVFVAPTINFDPQKALDSWRNSNGGTKSPVAGGRIDNPNGFYSSAVSGALPRRPLPAQPGGPRPAPGTNSTSTWNGIYGAAPFVNGSTINLNAQYNYTQASTMQTVQYPNDPNAQPHYYTQVQSVQSNASAYPSQAGYRPPAFPQGYGPLPHPPTVNPGTSSVPQWTSTGNQPRQLGAPPPGYAPPVGGYMPSWGGNSAADLYRR